MSLLLAELGLLLVLASGGHLLLHGLLTGPSDRLGRISRMALALLLGTALHLLVGSAWLVLALPGFLLGAPAATLGLSGLVAWRAGARPQSMMDLGAFLLQAGAITAALSSAVVTIPMALREVAAPDAYDNTALAGLLVSGAYDSVRPFLLLTRSSGVAVLLAPSIATGAPFGLGVQVVLAVATWALVLGIAGARLRATLNPVQRRAVLILATATVLALPGVLAQAVFINGHHVFAGLLTLAAFGAWELARPTLGAAASGGGRSPWLIVALPLAALVVLRPDGVFYAGVVLAAALVAVERWGPVRRSLILVGSMSLAWWGFVALRLTGRDLFGVEVTGTSFFDIGDGRAFSVLPTLALSLAFVLLALLPAGVVAWRRHGLFRAFVEVAPWAIVGVLVLVDADRLGRSLSAIHTNLIRGAGEWTAGVVVLVAAGVLVTLLAREREGWVLRFPVSTFLPLLLLLRFPSGAYRVGWGDSLNRSIMHVLPLLLLVLLLGIGREARRPSLTPGRVVDAARRVAPVGAAAAAVVLVLVGVARSPIAHPFAANVARTDADLASVLGALDDDARLVVVIDGDPSRQLARQLAAARSGTTRVVEPSELAATLERWPTDAVLGAQCLSVPGGATSLASGAQLPRPGVLNPGSGDWEQILAGGSARRAPDWQRWSLVARAGAGDDLAGQGAEPDDTLPGPVTLRAIDGSPSGGGSGLIAHLGTRGPDGLSEVSRFRNPAATGMLCPAASSVLIGGVDGISDRSGSDGDRGDGGGIGILHTDDDADAAVTLELGPDRSLRLETVALRQRGDDAAALLRDFAVDIRLDGDWFTVGEGRHEGGPASWHRLDLGALPPTDAVRIRRTGPNSTGTGHLVIDDVELYGVLATTQR